MGNQFIHIINGQQVLVSYPGIHQRPVIHGVVVDSNRDNYLVRMNYGNIDGFSAPIGSYARPMNARHAANWISIYEFEAA